MNTGKRLPAVMACAILLSRATAGTDAPPQRSVQVVGAAKCDFGKHHAGRRQTARFKIRNAGKSPVRIVKVRKACGCTEAYSTKPELNAGEEADIVVTLLADSLNGPYTKNVFVETSDAPASPIRLAVAGEAVPLVAVLPSAYAYAGRIPLGQSWSQSFQLKPSVTNAVLDDPKVESNFPVKTEFARPTNTAEQVYSLSVTIEPPARSGDLNCTISIPVLAPTNNAPIKVSVSAKAGCELYAIPKSMPVPFSEQSVVRTFRLRMSAGGPPPHPQLLKLPQAEGASFNAKKDPRDGSLMVTATLSSEFVRQLFAENERELLFEMPGAASAKMLFRSTGSPPAQEPVPEPEPGPAPLREKAR